MAKHILSKNAISAETGIACMRAPSSGVESEGSVTVMFDILCWYLGDSLTARG